MNSIVILAVIALAVMALTLSLFFLGSYTGTGNNAAKNRMRSMVDSQHREEAVQFQKTGSLKATTEITAVQRTSDAKMTLSRKLKYAQWSHIPPYFFSIAQVVLSLFAFIVIRQYFGIMLQLLGLLVGPILVNAVIMWRVNWRFEKFDNDYPQFLLSLVGLLKTGMNPVQALEAASSGLGEESLVHHEVELMLERMRLGVAEERSIGSFGEDVNHQEIELFVQALLLSRRVGGTLSDTLERLARQVRKRQFFRRSAQAAVALQRGSVNMILLILVGLEAYIYMVWPDAVTDMWKLEATRPIGEGGILVIILGLYWVRQVSKIRT